MRCWRGYLSETWCIWSRWFHCYPIISEDSLQTVFSLSCSSSGSWGYCLGLNGHSLGLGLGLALTDLVLCLNTKTVQDAWRHAPVMVHCHYQLAGMQQFCLLDRQVFFQQLFSMAELLGL